MKKQFKTLSFIFVFAAMASISSCETTSEQDRSTNISSGGPANSETTDKNTANTTGNTNDTNKSGGSVYEPGPVKDDFDVDYNDGKTTRDYNENSKTNGVREPNEYPSGRTGGQYTNPKATTTPSGTNTNENPGTGSPSKTGSTGK